MSYLDDEFLRTYQDELEDKTADEILSFLRKTVGTTTKNRRQEIARAKLAEISGRQNEPFTLFLERCTSLSKKITDDSIYTYIYIYTKLFGGN
jgi:hypothetical protein